MTELITRAFQFRADTIDHEAREIVGIAVPYNRDADIGGGYVERFAPGAVQDSDDALLYYRHAEPIGRIVEATDTAEGWQIRARISATAVGNDALTLARDGVVTQLSIGFESLDDSIERREDGTNVITRNRVRAREVSLVPFGAYAEGAQITEVRERPNERKAMPESNADAPDLTEVRERIDELERRSAQFQTRDETPSIETRSAAEILKAVAAGDEATVRQINSLNERAYAGGTSADTVARNPWVADLTRIFDGSSGVLASIFSTGTLPAEGNNVEFAELATNTVSVTEQAAEGDDLALGKITLTTRTAPVKTYGGYVQLSRQQIERSSLPVLDRSLEALATAAGARKKAVLRAAFAALVTARRAIAADAGVVTLGATLAASDAGKWEDVLIDAAIKYDEIDASPESLVVSAAVFKKLRSLTVSGERVFQTFRDNASGELNLPGLTGNLAGLPVYLDPGQPGNEAVFVNGRAIRQYDSALVNLQDENVINLSKDFSVYRYGAVAAEVPSFVVPVKITP